MIAKSGLTFVQEVNLHRLYQKGFYNLYPVGMALPLESVKNPVPDSLCLVEFAASVEFPWGKKLAGAMLELGLIIDEA